MEIKTALKNLVLALFIVAALVFGIFYWLKNASRQSRATLVQTMNFEQVAPESFIKNDRHTSTFSFYKEDGYIYKNAAATSSQVGVSTFINNNPTLDTENLGEIRSFIKDSTDTKATAGKILPENFLSNSGLVKTKSDSQDKYLLSQDISLDKEHYYYNQKINNLPVYGAILAVHLQNSNEVYAMNGNLVIDETIKSKSVSTEQAETIALDTAKKTTTLELKIAGTKEYVFNGKILGINDDNNNYPALEVTINSIGQPLIFSRHYFIDLSSGKILLEENLLQEVLNRGIYNCSGGSCPSSPTRSETSSAATGIADVDSAFSYFGQIFNFFKNNYDRDSYNNQGAILEAGVNYPSKNSWVCPNAAWISSGTIKEWYFCPGMSTLDVIAHEYTHAVTESTADLEYLASSGALNESISDIFAATIDGNWTLGEGSATGVVRNMANPTQTYQYTCSSGTCTSASQPDRLFSGNFRCDGQTSSTVNCNSSNDYCGVHRNNGVMNKAFYLMSDGGSFNGCSITGVGKQVAANIIYQALTTYLTSTSNFRAMYTAALQACSDLYGSSSTTCQQVTKALKAVELNQQAVGTQANPKCTGATAVNACTTETTTTPTITPSPTPTTSSTTDATATPVPTSTLTPTPSNTPTPTLTPTPCIFSPATIPTYSGNATLNFKLKFQGIMKAVASAYNTQLVKIKIQDQSTGEVSETRLANFSQNGSSVWEGNVKFDVVAGDKYKIFIKGPRHIQKKICDSQPSETVPGYYQCSDGNIALTSGTNNLDFTGIIQVVGDLSPQDGIVNSYDVSLIVNNLGKKDCLLLKVADLNLDGIIDTQDYSLIISALAIKLDEN